MPLSVDAKRQILYAALLQHSSEVGSLRERVLDRLVLVSLLGTSSRSPLTISAIRNHMHVAPGSSSVRAETVQQTVNRLRRANTVDYVLHRNKPSYYLTELGRRQTDDATETAAELFRPVLTSMLRDTRQLCSVDEATQVFRTFVSECFARFGQQIALEVTGGYSKDQLLGAADVSGAFQAAVRSLQLSEDAKSSLKARCIRFLKSNAPHDTQLKFHLTQGYYVAQLLGISTNGFNPLAEDAFSDAIFYVDTNVLVRSLLSDELGRSLHELVRVCRTLNVDVRVSRATIDEMQALVEHRHEELHRLVPLFPNAMVEKTHEDFLDAFREAKDRNSSLTLDLFFTRFDDVTQTLRNFGITIHNERVAAIIGGRKVKRECDIVREAAQTTRLWADKTDTVCRHDVAHYLLVVRARKIGRKAWFLTRDKTLGLAAARLDPGQPSFCFSFAGFLQSVSPFMEAPDVQGSLVDLFSAVLAGEISDPAGDSLFDLQDLKVISEFHSDVLATPEEDLLPAFDYVKNEVLLGQPFREHDHREVALELKKFLSSRSEERLRSLESQVLRGRKQIKEEREQQKKDREQLESERKGRKRIEQDLIAREETIADLERDAKRAGERQAASYRRERRWEIAVAGMGSLIAIGLWSLDAAVVASAMESAGLENEGSIPMRVAVRLAAGGIFVGSVLGVVRRQEHRLQMTLLSVAFAVAVAASGVVAPETMRTVAPYGSIGGILAVLVLSALGWSRVGQPHDK